MRREPGDFPWGSNEPTRAQRFVVAAVIATIAGSLTAIEYVREANHHSDFGQILFGARALLDGVDPWKLVGPGLAFDWSWPLLYPAPSLIVGLPFTALEESYAATLFIWLSSFLLAWGATQDTWNRLPAFASLPFIVASSAGQWSALLASTWFIPALGVVWIAKPTLGFSLAFAAPSRKVFGYALGGGVVLLAISFFLMPSWFQSWTGVLGSTSHMRAPITQWGGFAIAASLLCWRRPEARLVFALACVPHSPAVYDLILILLVVPKTYHESAMLSLFCTAGLLIANLGPEPNTETFVSIRGMMNVACCYLPATILILRRPNVVPPTVARVARA